MHASLPCGITPSSHSRHPTTSSTALTAGNLLVTRQSSDWSWDTTATLPHHLAANLVRSDLRIVRCPHSTLDRRPLVRRSIHWAILHMILGPAFEPRHLAGCPLDSPHSIRLHTALDDFPTLPAPFPTPTASDCSSSLSSSLPLLVYGSLRDSYRSWPAAHIPIPGETASPLPSSLPYLSSYHNSLVGGRVRILLCPLARPLTAWHDPPKARLSLLLLACC